MRSRRGFSIVELMISLALVGTLAAVAAPAWEDARLRAERAEVPANLDGIVAAEVAYGAAFERYVWVDSFLPDALPGKRPRAWAGPAFDSLGWAPDGMVRGSYAVYTSDRAAFEAHGVCDVDGDGAWSWWRATPAEPAAMLTVADEY